MGSVELDGGLSSFEIFEDRSHISFVSTMHLTHPRNQRVTITQLPPAPSADDSFAGVQPGWGRGEWTWAVGIAQSLFGAGGVGWQALGLCNMGWRQELRGRPAQHGDKQKALPVMDPT